jgi:hypothetical protein
MDTLDAVAAAVLTTAGLDETTTRRVLTFLWQQPTPTHNAARPILGLRVSDVEWSFLRELGTRIQAVRTARRLGLPAIARVTGIPYQQLLDAERGTAILSVLGVYRVAEALEVLPADLITDVEPLELLRRLSARMRGDDPSPYRS